MEEAQAIAAEFIQSNVCLAEVDRADELIS